MADLYDVMAFEKDLANGQTVEIRWTNNGGYYHGTGTVAKVNKKSLRVALAEPVASKIGGEGYPVGREIVVPRFGFGTTWSTNNRAEPVGGY